MCKLDSECMGDEETDYSLCPDQTQAINVVCCFPKKRKPAPLFNLTSCADAGGICNHVIYDECRNGLVVYDLQKPCLDGPRRYDCCVK